VDKTVLLTRIRLRQSDLFTFFVGTQKDVFNIHSKVLQGLSKPLHSLVTNTFLKEAQEKNACLAEEDKEVFTLFMEWAYTRSYRVRKNGPITLGATTAKAAAKSSKVKMPYGSLSSFYCTSCASRCSDFTTKPPSTFPFCAPCSDTHRCVVCGTKMRRQENRTYACKECSKRCDVDPIDLRATSSHRLEVFRNRSYPVANASHTNMRKFLNAKIPADEVADDLLIHARVFLFADKWLISELKELALHKLHRDICEYHIIEDEGAQVVKLLEYCFATTSSGGDVHNEHELERNNGDFRELKELVFAYAACKSEQLLQCTQFRRLLQNSGDMALQFIDAVNCRFS
jgi:hypothetical protein